MNYYEFNKQEHCALIKANSINEAFNAYVDDVAGESVTEVMNEGLPETIDKYDAFIKFLKVINEFYTKYDITFNIDTVIETFEDDEIKILFIDGALSLI